MRSSLRFIIISLSALVVGACTSVHGILPPVSQPAYPISAASPDLSTKNYVATYPVAETGNYIATGSDGNLWFTTSQHVVRITPGGTETYYANSGGFAVHIAAGQSGALWYTNFNTNIGKITTGGSITIIPVAGASKIFDIAKGPDGNMWFTEQNAHSIGKITPAGVSTLFAIPSGATPVGITAGPDGNLWFSATGGSNVQEFGKVTTAAGAFTEYAIPSGTPGSPGAMTKGPDGNLYSTNSNGGVYSITTAGTIQFYPTSLMSTFEDGIAVGPDKQIWISPGDAANDLVEFNTARLVFSKAAAVPIASFCSPTLHAIPRGLTLGPDGDMWFVTEGCAYVGAYEEKIFPVGVRLTSETSINDPTYGFELGYFNGTTSTTSETVMLSAGESVQFQNVDPSLHHTASFLGDASASGAPWPATFNGNSTQSPAGTAIGSTGFSTGTLNPGNKSLVYETGLPGFYMMGCAFHYISKSMRTVIVVH